MSETNDLLRARFNELRTKREQILAQSEPLRMERDRISNDATIRCRELAEQIKGIELGLFDLDMDLGRLAKALGGRSLSDNRG